ncbi:unnamed protein product [Adineta ricciae]|uniref:Uncharacterized protein n=1 Tax=Adineta ricciae TaxID=249248 RepID=A0A814X2R2_ADIRI|nr:unnamed protein product [Adineta ricciae]
MLLKRVFNWIHKNVSSYNLFLSEENDYDDHSTVKDPTVLLKLQKYKTWLYSVLLTVCLYVLFYGTLIQIEAETVVVSPITLDVFDQLYAERSETLACPCSTITIPYNKFLVNIVKMHPVCSSIFVSKEWIDGLYLENAGLYGVWDFRKSAYGQFEILSRLCSLSQDIVTALQNSVNNTELVTINLLSRRQTQLEIYNSIESQKNKAFSRMTSFLNYWRTTIERNYLASAFGTNWGVYTYSNDESPFSIGYQTVYYGENSFTISCGQSSDSVITAVLPLPSNDSSDFDPIFTTMPMSNVTNVKGFFLACTPLDALLASTLDCLYDFACLQLLFYYFQNLNQTNFNWNNSILSSQRDNTSVLVHFQNLFVENWSTQMSYSTYFDLCSPSACTYSTTSRRNLSYGITLFISLYGGLTIILRLVASQCIDLIYRCKYRSTDAAEEDSNQQNQYSFKPIVSLKQLNLFKNINLRAEENIQQQKITTRVYFILLIGSMFVLCLVTSLDSQIQTIIVSNPSFTTYTSLESKYSTTLRCPCANKTMFYRRLLSLSPVFHQVCSSGFVQSDWIEQMINSMRYRNPYDWRGNAYKQFQVLSDLCQLANQTIIAAMDRFLSQSFIASSVMNEIDFNEQLNANLNQFYQSTAYTFDLMNDIIRFIQQVNQFYEGTVKLTNYYDPILPIISIENTTNNYSIARIGLLLYGIQDIDSGITTCLCATNPYCQRRAIISDLDPIVDYNYIYGYGFNHNLTGWMEGCLAHDSILLSTLECLYADSDCFPFLMSYIIKSNTDTLSLPMSSFRLQPLVDNLTTSRYQPNATVSMMVQQLMLEEWNLVSSYRRFYDSCAPLYCSYAETMRRQNFFGVMITFISMIGGITVTLRILTPQLVKFALSLLSTCARKSSRSKQSNHHSSLVQRRNGNRLKVLIWKLMTLIRSTIVGLNIFPFRAFGTGIDRATAKRYGQWATRLYFILFITMLVILAFYTVIQPRTVTKKFEQPSLTYYYNHLRESYGDDLKCTCSKIASTYHEFVSIQPVFHSICSSQFVSDEWRVGLTNGFASNLSGYAANDYHRFLSAHLFYLQQICQHSIQTANNSINEFLTSLLVTNELLSANDFSDRLKILIEQSKSNAPILFSQLLFFTQTVIHGNAFISTYATNFQYVYVMNGTDAPTTPAEALVYDDECSCARFPNCTTQANFIEADSSANVPIKGIKVGCTPSESLLASTLECFYDQLCLDLIQHYTNYENSSTPLSTTSSQFSQNTTIDELRQNLFIERWLTKTNYSSYYQQCSPLLCTYTSIENFNILYAITLILGLQGGLTIVLKWLCPKFVRVALKIHQNRKTRTILIHPVVLSGTNIRHTNWNGMKATMDTTLQNNTTPCRRSLSKIVFVLVVLLCILLGVILFSIYYARRKPACQLMVKQLSVNTTCSSTNFGPYLIADLNDDNQIDLLFCCDSGYIINVLLADSNGSYGEVIAVPSALPFFSSILQVNADDINNDGLTDLIILSSFFGSAGEIYFLLGTENKTFEISNIDPIFVSHYPTDISIVDLNNDTNLDLIVIAQYTNEVYLYFGDENRTFSTQSTLFIEYTSDPRQLAIADYNNDSYMDIAVFNRRSLHIHVFFQNTDGSFQSPKWLYTSFDTSQVQMIAGDFDHDHQSDIVFLHSWKNTVSMRYRYQNETFHSNQQVTMPSFTSLSTVSVSHLNGDKYLDIVVGSISSNKIYGLLGDENGQFQTQIIYSSVVNNPFNDINDFNGNTCREILNIKLVNDVLHVLINPCQCRTH